MKHWDGSSKFNEMVVKIVVVVNELEMALKKTF